ncbi:class I adenylate-forming enzyme family protein [Sedimentitalea sp. XS_ASV28]|uniref:class I adenylate-forming enzyme family protein n=1 Tax=Sedimentitalea sp. XS_ASV28 TaxID=3241296 RepID=UPI003512CD49
MTRFSNLGMLINPACAMNKIAVQEFGRENDRAVTYGALDTLANKVANGLISRGYERNDRIAILSANSSDYLAVHLGVMRAGMISVPINHRLPLHLVEYIIGDSGARQVFCDRDRQSMVQDGIPTINFDDPGALAGFGDEGSFDAVEPDSGDIATFLYTSGSTGKPKGVMLSHDAQRWVIEQRLQNTSIESQNMLIAAPLYHMNALALSHLVLAGHASMVLMPQFNARAYTEAVARFRCTWLTSVPPMIAMMLDDKEAIKAADFSSVQHLRMGSAPASATLLAEIRRNFSKAKIHNAYGTTEGSPIVFGPHPDGKPTPDLSLGYRNLAVDLRLMDAAGMEADEGVLQMRSPGLMSGYHNRPDLALPFTDDGYYVTGDIFSRDNDGFYYFVGRADDMFVSGGENIFPGEIERMLESHPDVVQACVVPVDDAIKGKKPVAFIRLSPDATLDEDTLKVYALENGASYQHPREIWFLDEIPLASTNKVDRPLLTLRANELIKSAAKAHVSPVSTFGTSDLIS